MAFPLCIPNLRDLEGRGPCGKRAEVVLPLTSYYVGSARVCAPPPRPKEAASKAREITGNLAEHRLNRVAGIDHYLVFEGISRVCTASVEATTEMSLYLGPLKPSGCYRAQIESSIPVRTLYPKKSPILERYGFFLCSNLKIHGLHPCIFILKPCL